MGRTLPYECHHGSIIDYGDFGPHQNGCPPSCFEPGAQCPDHPTCEECEREAEAAGQEWQARMTEMLRELADDIARAMARARFGPGVTMDGRHNPRPTEIREAQVIVESFTTALMDHIGSTNHD